ncbi:hypothetical protein [Streptomyces sp. NBC_01304]|uniref:hypothetical protein n=1 Tax=Streptomyces sp. NBC_01304 TaxID=2903818 RepID=UPI002E132A30|nr:hypothetical protein OG430_31795 [Streptomyces sp. NBC_01304]
MEAVIAVVALLFVLFVALGVFVTVKVVTAAKRGVDRTVAQARRTVEDTQLRARTFAQPGPAGELAQLRLKLRTSMRATQDALGAGIAEDASLQESMRLFERLSAHGHELDDALRLLEREPDKGRLGERLPELRERTQQITDAADSLRWAARDRARKFADDDLADLGRQIDVESGALRHWDAVPEAGTHGSGTGAASGSAGPAPKTWPEPTLVDGPAAPAEQTWPEQARASDDDGPQAIAPSRPVTYPWQKQARPEGTT